MFPRNICRSTWPNFSSATTTARTQTSLEKRYEAAEAHRLAGASEQARARQQAEAIRMFICGATHIEAVTVRRKLPQSRLFHHVIVFRRRLLCTPIPRCGV